MDDLPADPEHDPVNVAVRAPGQAAPRSPAAPGVVAAPATRAIPAALTEAFRAEAAELSDRHDETVCLHVLDGADAVLVSAVEPSRPDRVPARIGARLPAFAAASGRVLLAALAARTVDGMYAGNDLVTPTGRRLEGLGELHRILGRARANGHAENAGETAHGLTCLAAPVSGPRGRVLAAIAVCVPAERMDAPRRAQLLDDLRIAAGRASATVRAATAR
jgi:DNA-binding IclR family transcriptional regulator